MIGSNFKICLIHCHKGNESKLEKCVFCGRSLTDNRAISFISRNWGVKPTAEILAYAVKTDARMGIIYAILKKILTKKDDFSKKIEKTLSSHHEWKEENRTNAAAFLIEAYLTEKRTQSYVLDIIYSITRQSPVLEWVFLNFYNRLKGRELPQSDKILKRSKFGIIYLIKKVEEAEKTKRDSIAPYFGKFLDFLKEPNLNKDVFDVIREIVMDRSTEFNNYFQAAKMYKSIAPEYQPYLMAYVMLGKKKWREGPEEARKEIEQILTINKILDCISRFSRKEYTDLGHPDTSLLLEHMWAVFCICADFSKEVNAKISRARLMEAAYFHDICKIVHILNKDDWLIIEQIPSPREKIDIKKFRTHVSLVEVILDGILDKEIIDLIKKHHNKYVENLPKEVQILKIADCVNRAVNVRYKGEMQVSSINIEDTLTPETDYGRKMRKAFLDFVDKKVINEAFMRFGRDEGGIHHMERREYIRFPVDREITVTIFEVLGKKSEPRKISVLLRDISQTGVLIQNQIPQVPPRWDERINLGSKIDIVPQLTVDEVSRFGSDSKRWIARATFDKMLDRKILWKIVDDKTKLN